jgi:uncharacterized glyoxalase superfamily protein PhnB
MTGPADAAFTLHGICPLLQVFDMAASLRFYRDVLGFTVVQQAGPENDVGWALLTLRGAELMLNTAYETDRRPPGPEPARQAAHQDTALYFGCESLDALHAHLVAHGVDAAPPHPTGYGFRAVTVRDPDGYALTFHWPATQEQYDRWVERYGLPPRTVGNG